MLAPFAKERDSFGGSLRGRHAIMEDNVAVVVGDVLLKKSFLRSPTSFTVSYGSTREVIILMIMGSN